MDSHGDDDDDDASTIAMSEKKKLDFFDVFVFDSDEEEEGLTTEPQGEHVPLIDLTVDSDDDGPSNSTPGVVQQEQAQSSSRQPRGVQPGQGQEPATDSEDEEDDDDDEESSEDEDSSDDEASSSSNRRPVKTGARRKGNVHSLETITFSQFEEKDKDGAQRVLDFYRDDRRQALVHICSLFMGGKCTYMCKDTRDLSRHMKSFHPKEKHPGYKITEYPGFEDRKVYDFVTKTYSELKKTDSKLADEALALYTRPQNTIYCIPL